MGLTMGFITGLTREVNPNGRILDIQQKGRKETIQVAELLPSAVVRSRGQIWV